MENALRIIVVSVMTLFSIGNKNKFDVGGDRMRMDQGGGSELAECGDVKISIDNLSGVYGPSDTVSFVLKNLTADSILVSVSLEGKSKEWESVVHDVFRFAKGGSRLTDEMTTEKIRPFDSIRVGIPLFRIRLIQRKYSKWRFYAYELSFPPIMDFKCYVKSPSFAVK